MQDGTAQRTHRLAIVVLTYGQDHAVVDAAIKHMYADGALAGSDLVIVHNPSQMGETIKPAAGARGRLVELESNRGYVGGMNAGIQVAQEREPDLVFLVTHDVRIAGSDVRGLCELMHGNCDLATIGPLLCTADGVAYSAGFVQRKGARMQHRRPSEHMTTRIWECAAVDGAAMMWRASALKDVQGFDERFFMYYEDVDICARARRCGWRVAVATGVLATSSLGKSNRRRAHAYLRARNGLAYARKEGTAGLAFGLAECARGLWQSTPKPGGQRIRDAGQRRSAATYWHGTLCGIRDYFRGRWGAPPPAMLLDSDIAATSADRP
jgi:N-acetylglucosaminyl-diphospho-decaprenol L-rhamnosyltransferase